MNKHTPGPWVKNGPYIEKAFKLARARIAIVDDGPWIEEDAEANARLIAAAPQMLEALEAVAPMLHWLDQEQGIHLAGDMLHGNILAVIAAAKGES